MNPAVLLIDMQKQFLNEHSKESKNIIIPSQLEVLDYCAKVDVPVVLVEYSYNDTILVLKDKLRFVPRNKKVVKHHDDAFDDRTGPNLEEVLDSFDADYLVFMGINANSCVKATASTALTLGYKICTSADLIADCYASGLGDISFSEEIIGWFKPSIKKESHKFLAQHAVDFYKLSSTFFDNYKDLIKHLEALK